MTKEQFLAEVRRGVGTQPTDEIADALVREIDREAERTEAEAKVFEDFVVNMATNMIREARISRMRRMLK